MMMMDKLHWLKKKDWMLDGDWMKDVWSCIHFIHNGWLMEFIDEFHPWAKPHDYHLK